MNTEEMINRLIHLSGEVEPTEGQQSEVLALVFALAGRALFDIHTITLHLGELVEVQSAKRS